MTPNLTFSDSQLNARGFPGVVANSPGASGQLPTASRSRDAQATGPKQGAAGVAALAHSAAQSAQLQPLRLLTGEHDVDLLDGVQTVPIIAATSNERRVTAGAKAVRGALAPVASDVDGAGGCPV